MDYIYINWRLYSYATFQVTIRINVYLDVRKTIHFLSNAHGWLHWRTYYKNARLTNITIVKPLQVRQVKIFQTNNISKLNHIH